MTCRSVTALIGAVSPLPMSLAVAGAQVARADVRRPTEINGEFLAKQLVPARRPVYGFG
jgi:hypothetical protein